MLPINMNHFYYFYAVAKRRSFTEASRELMVSQSSLSIQIKNFERSLGLILFHRRKTGVQLTEPGEIAYQAAEKIFGEVEGLLSSLKEVEHSVKGHISIGTVNSVGIYVLPDLLKSFNKEYPEVKITIDFKHSREVIDMVHAGKADLAIITWYKKYPDLSAFPLQKNKMFLVAHPDNPLAGSESISPRELEKFPFIAYETGTPTRMVMDALFRRMGLDIEYVMESSNVATIKHMVMTGLGLAFLPEVAVGFEIRQELLVRLSVPSLAMVQELTLYTKANRTLSTTARTFVDFIHDKLARSKRSGRKKPSP